MGLSNAYLTNSPIDAPYHVKVHQTVIPPFTSLPDVGFHVGTRSEVKYLVLQAHYATPLSEKDSSGVSLMYTLNP